jgi:NAD(P)-dependent dehydrogenase (short-subunit alcohol dehydrogenase family)
VSVLDQAWSLSGRVAIVTGAGRGLGRACAVELARAGAELLLVARTRSELDDAVAEIEQGGGRASALVADVTIEDEAVGAVATAARLGELAICVNAAGTNRTGPARDYPTADWDALFAVNVRATFLVCRSVGDTLLQRGAPGSVINISSQMGSVGFPGRAAYCSTKHAVEGLTKALAVEWAPQGIRVNTVAPTFVDTPLTRPMFDDAEVRAEIHARIPSGRLATLADVANAARYLACDASASVTGHTLLVDGGWTAW